MAKDRNIICKHYQCAGVCAITKHKCHVLKRMQHCDKYEPLKGSDPIRVDRRAKALSRARKREDKEA